jgi:restriction system protein
MARRHRGFFAELQHQAAVNARKQQQAQAAAQREHAGAVRAHEQAQRQERLARERYERATALAAKEAERDAKDAYVTARQAEADALNSELLARLSELDTLLEATLAVDDYVDLSALRRTAEHPPFVSDNEAPIAALRLAEVPPEPVLIVPEKPSGLKGAFGKKRYEQHLQEVQRRFARDHEEWQAAAAAVPSRQLEQMEEYRRADQGPTGTAGC